MRRSQIVVIDYGAFASTGLNLDTAVRHPGQA